MTRQACARGGCTAPTDGKYCSKRCTALARLCAGWRPGDVLNRSEVKALASRRGQAAATRARRRKREREILARIAPILESILAGLDPKARAAIRSTGYELYVTGRADGYQEGWHAKNVPALKRKGAAA